MPLEATPVPKLLFLIISKNNTADARTSEVAGTTKYRFMHMCMVTDPKKNMQLFWGTFLECKNNMAVMWKFLLTFSVTTVSNEPLDLDMRNLVWSWIISLQIVYKILFISQQSQTQQGSHFQVLPNKFNMDINSTQVISSFKK
jgi:hypothetical protein